MPEMGGVKREREGIVRGGATAGSGRGYGGRGGVMATGGGVNKKKGRGYGRKWARLWGKGARLVWETGGERPQVGGVMGKGAGLWLQEGG